MQTSPTNSPIPVQEWLAPDGLGGFASGTSTGIRSRRHHAILLSATIPPTRRIVLVNGFDAWVETEGGQFVLTSQYYTPDVIGGDGAQRIQDFIVEPWPKWTFGLEDGAEVRHELLVTKGTASYPSQTADTARSLAGIATWSLGEILRLDEIVLTSAGSGPRIETTCSKPVARSRVRV